MLPLNGTGGYNMGSRGQDMLSVQVARSWEQRYLATLANITVNVGIFKSSYVLCDLGLSKTKHQ